MLNKNHYLYRDLARQELTEGAVYHRLASREKNPGHRRLLERLAAQENKHYSFWLKLAGSPELKPGRFQPALFELIRTFCGITFAVKLLEKKSSAALNSQRQLIKKIPPRQRAAAHKFIEDGLKKEIALISQIKEKRITYLSFVVLGLADAIVEITGVHAGFLGVTGSTIMAGITGLIVGFAAAVSMAAAAFLQAKQNASYSPLVSALATGTTYIISIVLLALPYFWLAEMGAAFVASTAVGLALIAAFTYYGAIVFDRRFWKEFLEAAVLMLGTALATYFVGKIIGAAFGLEGAMF